MAEKRPSEDRDDFTEEDWIGDQGGGSYLRMIVVFAATITIGAVIAFLVL